MPDLRDRMQQRAGQATEQRTLRDLHRQAAAQETAAVDNLASLFVHELVIDEHIQVRVKGVEPKKVEQYAIIMREAAANDEPYPFPPIVVFRHRGTFYLADGFHRVEAARRVGIEKLRAEVRPGTLEDASEYAEEANLEHGIYLSTADKRNIYERRHLRGHPWAQEDLRKLAKVLGVAHTTIGRWRSRLEKGAVANAPVAEAHAKGQKASGRYSGVRTANKRRGPTELQLRQRTLKGLRTAVESLYRLERLQEAESLEKYADSLVKEWKL